MWNTLTLVYRTFCFHPMLSAFRSEHLQSLTRLYYWISYSFTSPPKWKWWIPCILWAAVDDKPWPYLVISRKIVWLWQCNFDGVLIWYNMLMYISNNWCRNEMAAILRAAFQMIALVTTLLTSGKCISSSYNITNERTDWYMGTKIFIGPKYQSTLITPISCFVVYVCMCFSQSQTPQNCCWQFKNSPTELYIMSALRRALARL